MYLFKRIKIVILCFLPFIVKGQIPVQRSTSGVTVMDSRLKANLNLVGPVYHDTTAANVQKGLDSLAAQIYDSTHNIYWFRGWNGAGGKKWITFGGSSLTNPMTTKGDIIYENAALAPDRLAGNTTTIRRWLNSTGTGAAPNLPFYDTLASSDITNALGYTPYPSTNPNGYISSLTLPPLYLKNGLHARDSVTAVLGGQLDSITNIIGGTFPIKFTGSAPSPALISIFDTAASGSVSRAYFGVFSAETPALFYKTANTATEVTNILNLRRSNLSGLVRLNSGASIVWDLPAPAVAGNVQQAATESIIITDTTLAAWTASYHLALTNLNSAIADKLVLSGNGSLQLNGYASLSTSTDSTTYKPIAMDASGNIKKMTNWIGGSGGGGSSLTRQNITSGSSHTVTGGNYLVQYNYASVQATETLTLPASPADQDIVDIQTGTTIAAPNAEITSFTISPNSGQTINPYSSVTAITLFSGAHIKLRYNSSGTFWDRLD